MGIEKWCSHGWSIESERERGSDLIALLVRFEDMERVNSYSIIIIAAQVSGLMLSCQLKKKKKDKDGLFFFFFLFF